MERVADFSSLLENMDILFFESTMPDEMLLRGCFGTTGVHRTSLSIEGHSCHIYNFDGKVSECEKWLGHCHDVHTVIFVVSLTGYCQNLPGTINEVSIHHANLFSSKDLLASSRIKCQSLLCCSNP